jgi:hypothetical protein
MKGMLFDGFMGKLFFHAGGGWSRGMHDFSGSAVMLALR